jgi:hypothetical protein
MACKENTMKFAVQKMNAMSNGRANLDYMRNSYDPLGRTRFNEQPLNYIPGGMLQ